MKIWRDWGRRPAKRVVPHPVVASGGEVGELVLHHSVTATGPFLEVVRGIQSYHLDGDEGYFDIAYKYLVSAEGPDVAVGRGSAQGGATGSGVDGRTFSVCFVGDYSDKLLGAQAIENERASSAKPARLRTPPVTRTRRALSAPMLPRRWVSTWNDQAMAVVMMAMPTR